VTAVARPAHGGYPGAVAVGTHPEPRGPDRARRHVDVALLRAGIGWLKSGQLDDAWVSQFGIYADFGPYRVNIAQGPPSGRSGGSVVTFHLRDGQRSWLGKPNGIAPDERDAIAEIVEQVAPVLYRWNGTSAKNDSCSFWIDVTPSADVARAYRNYHDVRWRGGCGPRVLTPEGWA
jgi:hypothetical protein